VSSYAAATGLRCFMFALGAVYAATPEEADQFADRHGLWNRRPDGTWGRDASEAHAQLSADQQAAYRARGGRPAREAQQAKTGAWMTRSVPGQPAAPEP
jgi:hypothetical protein